MFTFKDETSIWNKTWYVYIQGWNIKYEIDMFTFKDKT